MVNLEDLEQICPFCRGSGITVDPQWREWFREHPDESPPNSHPLQTIPQQILCIDCDGSGMVPSAQGEVLLEFIRKYYQRQRLSTFCLTTHNWLRCWKMFREYLEKPSGPPEEDP